MTEDVVRTKISPDEMKKNMNVYQQLLGILTDDTDRVTISGKKFLRKSGWLKMAVPFGISTSIIEEKREEFEAGYAYHFTVRAQVDGRSVDEVGTCDNIDDRPGSNIHVIRTMAKTRATSRAIASLMGKSEQSAEDVEIEKNVIKKNNSPSTQQLAELKSLGYAGAIPFSDEGANLLLQELRGTK